MPTVTAVITAKAIITSLRSQSVMPPAPSAGSSMNAALIAPLTAPAMMNHQPGTSQCTASATTPDTSHGIARRGPFHAGTSIAA